MFFRYEVITEAMKLMKLSFPALSKLCGTPESTLKKLARGEIEEPRLGTLVPAFKVLGLSIDRACGLAPERDIAAEPALHDVSMAKALQERIGIQDAQLNDCHTTITDQAAQISALKTETAALTRSVAHRDDIISEKNREITEMRTDCRRLRVALIVAVIAFMLFCCFLLWEALHPDQGLIRA